jgi:hypothetical protein
MNKTSSQNVCTVNLLSTLRPFPANNSAGFNYIFYIIIHSRVVINRRIQYARHVSLLEANGIPDPNACVPAKGAPPFSQAVVVGPRGRHHLNRVAGAVRAADVDPAPPAPAMTNDGVRTVQAQVYVHGLRDVKHPQQHVRGDDTGKVGRAAGAGLVRVSTPGRPTLQRVVHSSPDGDLITAVALDGMATSARRAHYAGSLQPWWVAAHRCRHRIAPYFRPGHLGTVRLIRSGCEAALRAGLKVFLVAAGQRGASEGAPCSSSVGLQWRVEQAHYFRVNPGLQVRAENVSAQAVHGPRLAARLCTHGACAHSQARTNMTKW